MPTICPNCLRPVRSEARFCGYCGSNLNPSSLDEASVALPIASTNDAAVINETIPPQPKPKPSGEKIRRTVLIVIVILLLLVLVATFLIHFWPTIGSYLGAVISLFIIRAPN